VNKSKALPLQRQFYVIGPKNSLKSWFKIVRCSQACRHPEYPAFSPNSKLSDLVDPVKVKLQTPYNTYYQFALDVLNVLSSSDLIGQRFHFEFGGHPRTHYYLIRLFFWTDMDKTQHCDFNAMETETNVSNFLIHHMDQFVLEAIDRWSLKDNYPIKVFGCYEDGCFAQAAPQPKVNENRSIDIVIPTRSVSLFEIKRCIDSVQRQIIPGDKIYLIDDNDVPMPELSKISQESSYIQLVVGDKNGVASARNSGLNAGSNSLVSFVDSDDYLLPGYFEVQRNFHNNNPSVAATGTWLQAFGSHNTIYPQWDGLNPLGLLMCLPPAGVLTWKRNVLLKNNFDLSFGAGFEDFDLVARVIAESYPIAVFDMPLYMYQRGHVSLSQSWSPIQERELRSKVNSNVKLLCRHKLSELFDLISLHGKKLLISHPDLVFRTKFIASKELNFLGLIIMLRKSRFLRKVWRILPESVRFRVFAILRN